MKIYCKWIFKIKKKRYLHDRMILSENQFFDYFLVCFLLVSFLFNLQIVRCLIFFELNGF